MLGTFVGIAISVGLAFIVGNTFDGWGPEGRADFDPLLYPMTGTILTVIFFTSIGVNAMASEYSSGMIGNGRLFNLESSATVHRGSVNYSIVSGACNVCCNVDT